MADPITVETAFIEEFDAGVHREFAKTKVQMRHTVRQRPGVASQTVHFHKLSKNEKPKSKVRRAAVAPTDPTHTKVSVTPIKYYQQIRIDDYDELRTNVNLRDEYSQNMGEAFARLTDEIILNVAVPGAALKIDRTTGGINMDNVFKPLVWKWGNENIPGDDRYFAVSPLGYLQCLAISEFSKADYLPESQLPWGQSFSMSKMFMSFHVHTVVDMPITSTARSNLAYQRSMLGLAIQEEVSTKWDYDIDTDEMVSLGAMAMEAVYIDNAFAVDVQITDNNAGTDIVANT